MTSLQVFCAGRSRRRRRRRKRQLAYLVFWTCGVHGPLRSLEELYLSGNCGSSRLRVCEGQPGTPEGAKKTVGTLLPLPEAWLPCVDYPFILSHFLSMFSPYIWKYDQRP